MWNVWLHGNAMGTHKGVPEFKAQNIPLEILNVHPQVFLPSRVFFKLCDIGVIKHTGQGSLSYISRIYKRRGKRKTIMYIKTRMNRTEQTTKRKANKHHNHSEKRGSRLH